MRPFVATLAITLLLIVSASIINAQEMEKEIESTTRQMPIMQGMMGGRGLMMHGGMMERGMMSQMGSGMMCPRCGKMMQGGMMQQRPMMQGMMGGRGLMMHGGMIDMNMPNAQKLLALADQLKLKEEQIKSLKTLSLNSQKESISQGAELSIARLELNSLLGQEEIDLAQVQPKVEQIAQLEADLKVAQIKGFILAKEILTREQQVLLKAITNKEATAVTEPATGKSEKMMPQAIEHEEHH